MARLTTKRGFTLIELLVVISIIVLLISILLPILRQSRRQVRVTQCLSNQRSLAIGLINYSIDDKNGEYPFHPAGAQDTLTTIWQPEYASQAGYSKHNWLSLYTDVVLGGNPNVGWCPVMGAGPGGVYWPSWGGTRDPYVDPEYPALMYRSDTDRYWLGYLIFASHTKPTYYGGGEYMLWANSGNQNTDQAPTRQGPSQDAILADEVSLQLGGGSEVYRDAHSERLELITTDRSELPGAYRDNNVAYGDGHAETHLHDFEDVSSLPGSWSGHFVLRNFLEPHFY